MRLDHLYTQIDATADMEALRSVFVSYIEQFGSDYFTAFTIGIDGKDDARYPYGTFEHPWTLHYVNRGFKQRDACLVFALEFSNEKLPIVWSRARDRMNPDELVVMDEAAKFGLPEGVVFPIENQNGSVTIFSIAGPEGFWKDEDTIAVLEAAAKRMHLRAMLLMGQDETRPVPGLSDAEMTVLEHMRHNRSNETIAQLECKSVNTVKRQRASLIKKLQAPSSAHARFYAFRLGLMNNNPK